MFILRRPHDFNRFALSGRLFFPASAVSNVILPSDGFDFTMLSKAAIWAKREPRLISGHRPLFAQSIENLQLNRLNLLSQCTMRRTVTCGAVSAILNVVMAYVWIND